MVRVLQAVLDSKDNEKIICHQLTAPKPNSNAALFLFRRGSTKRATCNMQQASAISNHAVDIDREAEKWESGVKSKSVADGPDAQHSTDTQYTYTS